MVIDRARILEGETNEFTKFLLRSMHEMCPTWEPETIMVDRGISASVYTDIFPKVNILHCCKHFLDLSAGSNLTEPGDECDCDEDCDC